MRLLLVVLTLFFTGASLRAATATGTFTAVYPTSMNANQQGVVFTWVWNTTLTRWEVTCVSGPSVGWAGGSSINGTTGTYTFYGQVRYGATNAAFAFGVFYYGSLVSGMTLPAGGPTTPPPPPDFYPFIVTLDNSGYPVGRTFRAVQNGNTVGEWVVPYEQIQTHRLELNTNDPVTVQVSQTALDLGGGVWTNDGPSWVDIDEITLGPPNVEPDPISITPPPAPQPPQSTETKNVWSNVTTTNTTNAVSNVVYAEGVDKTSGLLREISAKLSTSQTIEEPDTDDLEQSTESAETLIDRVSGLSDKLPDVPDYEAPQAYSSVFVSPVFKVGQIELQSSYDLSPYGPAIQPFRTVAAGCLSIIFFILYVRTIRSAFA